MVPTSANSHINLKTEMLRFSGACTMTHYIITQEWEDDTYYEWFRAKELTSRNVA